MAIKVKHGLAPAAALAGFAEGQGKRAVETARFTKTPIRRSGGGGTRSTGTRATTTKPVREPIERKPLPIMAPQIIGMRQPEIQTLGVGEKAFPSGNFNRQNEAVNAQAWERYRSQMMQSGAGDPGQMPSSGYAPRVSGGTTGPANVTQEYTPKQTEAFNGLSDAYAEAVASGEYTPEELTDIKRQIDAKRMGIEPVERMKPPSQYPEGQEVGQIWEQDGILWTRDEKGIPKEAAKREKPEKESTGQSDFKSSDILKMQESARKSLAKEYGDLESAVPQERVDEMVQNQIKGINRLAGGAGAADSVDQVVQTVNSLIGGAKRVDGGIMTPDGIVLKTGPGIRAFRKQAKAAAPVVAPTSGTGSISMGGKTITAEEARRTAGTGTITKKSSAPAPQANNEDEFDKLLKIAKEAKQ